MLITQNFLSSNLWKSFRASPLRPMIAGQHAWKFKFFLIRKFENSKFEFCVRLVRVWESFRFKHFQRNLQSGFPRLPNSGIQRNLRGGTYEEASFGMAKSASELYPALPALPLRQATIVSNENIFKWTSHCLFINYLQFVHGRRVADAGQEGRQLSLLIIFSKFNSSLWLLP